MSQKVKNTTGFTIIEVVIVLAIAGLIFAVVFIAVPQLQAAQRDTARQDAMGRLEAAIKQYQSHHKGQLPRNRRYGLRDLIGPNKYIHPDNFADPIGGQYSDGRPSYEDGTIYFFTNGRICNNQNTWFTSRSAGSERNYAIVYELEQGGFQCRDNQ